FPVLGGLWVFYVVQAEYPRARDLGEHLLRLAQEAHDPALLLAAHDALGQTFFFLGEFALARAHLEQVLTGYDPQQHRALSLLLGGEDPGVVCLGLAAGAWWFLGYPDQALQRIRKALILAQTLADPYSL